MIEVDLTELQKQSQDYLNMLTDNKQELRKEMIKFLKQNCWTDSADYGIILEFINDFFVQYENVDTI